MAVNSPENNDKLNINLRKAQNSLRISGIGVILFGIWEIFYALEKIFIEQINLRSYFEGLEDEEEIFMTAIAILIIIFLVIILPVYYYTGRSAMIVASGKKKKFLYLFIAMFLLFWKFSYILQTFDPGDKQADDSLTASLLVNLTCCITLIDLIISTISVYICRSRLKRK